MLKYFILFFLIVSFLNPIFATVYRVNNSLTTDVSQRIYKSINEANNANAVLAGDTLMIEGSAVEYASATITKRLVFIGTGYFLSSNTQTQANPLQSIVQEIELATGSSGSVLMGLVFSNGYGGYVPTIETNNIIITRCYLPNPISIGSSTTNVQILQNYFVSYALIVGYAGYTFSNLDFKNNIVGANNNGISLNITSDNTYQRIFSSVENNIFLGSVTLTASTFRNNIIVGTAATVTVSSSSILNNLVSNGQLPTSNGNQTYNAANLFVGAAGNSTDGQYQIKAASPYLTAGYNNIQPGVFGGTQSYVLSGLPPIPSIYWFTADGVANKQTGLPINIKVKANQ